jgi:hypothetical protein
MAEMRSAYIILVGKTAERCHLKDLGLGELIILKWILKELVVRVWTGFSCLRIR